MLKVKPMWMHVCRPKHEGIKSKPNILHKHKVFVFLNIEVLGFLYLEF